MIRITADSGHGREIFECDNFVVSHEFYGDVPGTLKTRSWLDLLKNGRGIESLPLSKLEFLCIETILPPGKDATKPQKERFKTP